MKIAIEYKIVRFKIVNKEVESLMKVRFKKRAAQSLLETKVGVTISRLLL